MLTWVLAVTTHLLPSQSRTLAVLVAAAIRCERPNLAQIGRQMAGPITAKSAIRRARRFTGNERIAVADGRPRRIGSSAHSRTQERSADPMSSAGCDELDEWVYRPLLHPQIPTYPPDFGALATTYRMPQVCNSLNAPIAKM
jgi:hypothetical protein